MDKYPKINTLYKRTIEKPCTIIPGDYRDEIYPNICLWDVYEKVDGTNIRITFSEDELIIRGKTDNADLSRELIENIKDLLPLDRLNTILPQLKPHTITLFGEGYGRNIQNPAGSLYRPDMSFILFDIKIGHWWLDSKKVAAISCELQILSALFIGRMSISTITDYVKSKPLSLISQKPQVMEGIIARTSLHKRDGERVMFKLKVKDYEILK
jgi:hypothetical protein